MLKLLIPKSTLNFSFYGYTKRMIFNQFLHQINYKNNPVEQTPKYAYYLYGVYILHKSIHMNLTYINLYIFLLASSFI